MVLAEVARIIPDRFKLPIRTSSPIDFSLIVQNTGVPSVTVAPRRTGDDVKGEWIYYVSAEGRTPKGRRVSLAYNTGYVPVAPLYGPAGSGDQTLNHEEARARNNSSAVSLRDVLVGFLPDKVIKLDDLGKSK